MSISTKGVIIGRILAATKHSPIAVFLCESKIGQSKNNEFRAVFAETVITRNTLQFNNCGDLVGVFYGTSGASEFENKCRLLKKH